MRKFSGIILFLFVIVLITLGVIFKKSTWEKSGKIFVLAQVEGKVSGTGPAREKYSYVINGKEYYGADYNLKQGGFYIVEVMVNDLNRHGISVYKQIDFSDLEKQPPEGWSECPINEDGTIKEKYKNKNPRSSKSNSVNISDKESEELTKEALEYINK